MPGKIIDLIRGKAKESFGLPGNREHYPTVMQYVDQTIVKPDENYIPPGHAYETVYEPTTREVVADRYRLILSEIRSAFGGKLPAPATPVTEFDRMPDGYIRGFLQESVASSKTTLFGNWLTTVLAILDEYAALVMLLKGIEDNYPDGVPAGMSVFALINECVDDKFQTRAERFAGMNGFTDGAELAEYVHQLFALPEEADDDEL